MMPSEGLTTTCGSPSAVRRQGRSSRVKQSCRLLNSDFFASDKSSSENSRQQAIDRSRTSEFSILLNQPMKRVTAARGIRLVNRKLRSSCSVSAEIRPLIVMNLSAALVSAGGMDSPLPILYLSTAAVAGAAAVFPKVKARLALSRAKHRSLSGHSKMSRMVARLVPFYEFDINDFFCSDGAPATVATKRRDGFFHLARLYQERYAQGRQMASEARTRISDLQFTETYRVPFQYSRLVREHLGSGAFMQSSAGVTVTDVDGNVFYDLTGSYGVNIFGNDFYKECITEAEKRAGALGPVLGPYHPVITDNVRRLCEISGLDEVSFHMSGTEAVMQAVRLARYHTRRSHLVRFAGAYHGWWGDVQPGVGNPVSPHETYTLADMVTYGKSLAGGLPVGVVCGRKELMRRFRDDRPADVCFARGTFNSHPYVMTAMDEFLSRLASPNFRAVYDGLEETWNGRAQKLNQAISDADLPVQVANLSS